MTAESKKKIHSKNFVARTPNSLSSQTLSGYRDTC